MPLRIAPRSFLFGGLIAVCLGALPAWAQNGGERPPTAVTVVTVQPETLTLTSSLPGRVKASAQAEVRPQVAGIITDRLFTEGGTVQKNDILYKIDQATYSAGLKQAEASVSSAQARLSAALRDLTRVEELLTRRVGTQQAVDDAKTGREQAQAELLVAEAQLLSAQIELDRTNIRARLSGEIGRSEISEGALVTASQTTPLAVIRTIDRIYVDVTQSAADVLRWRRSGTAALPNVDDHTVVLKLADGSIFDQTGTLTAAEPNVDEQTGVTVLRLTFDNPQKLLLPGMYVQVEMPTATVQGVFQVPQEGVTRDRRGRPMAMIVTAENVIEQRELSILQDRGSNWIVDGGLSAGDRIVVAGLQKIAVGATVNPTERSDTPETAPASAE